MAFELKHIIEEDNDLTKLNFWDDSGAYNLTTNPTGYGTPNVATSAITSSTLKVYPEGYSTPILFTFTIVSNTITVATKTAVDGTVTSILADMDSVVFPFTEAAPFVITGEMLGFGTDAEITSGGYYFEYMVTDGTTQYISTADQLIVGVTDCCINGMAKDLNVEDCKMNKSKIMAAFYARVFLDSAIWNMENGEVDKSKVNHAYAKSLCADGCSHC